MSLKAQLASPPTVGTLEDNRAAKAKLGAAWIFEFERPRAPDRGHWVFRVHGLTVRNGVHGMCDGLQNSGNKTFQGDSSAL